MKQSRLMVAASLAVAAGLVIASCSDQSVAPAELNSDPGALLLSHSPAAHGVSAAVSIAATPDYGGLDGAAADARGGGVSLSVNASGSIPRFPDSFIESVAVFGYAWADLATGQGIVAVLHPVIGRDSRQNPDGWHTHPVQLTGGTKPSGTSDFCVVAIGTSQGGISIQGDELRVNMSNQWAGVSAGALDVAASFVVQADAGCAGSGLGVLLLDTAGV